MFKEVIRLTAISPAFAIPTGPFNASASVQSFPARVVTLIVPFPPGGITDLNARILSRYLEKHWRQPVNVVNMPGGGGSIGTMHVLSAPKDGYTMMFSATGQATQNPAIDSKLPYQWDDPTLVGRMNVSPLVFVVKGDSPYHSLRQFVDAVKKDPAKFKYGTSGPGGVGSIVISVLMGASGVDIQKLGRVTLQGGLGLLEAVATGDTDFAVQYLAEMGPQLASGKLKPLAVSTAQRVKQLPDTPTSREAGFEDFTLIGWNGIVGPSKLPDDVVGHWTAAMKALIADAAFVTETEASGGAVDYLGPAEFKEALRAEYETSVKQVVKFGLRK